MERKVYYYIATTGRPIMPSGLEYVVSLHLSSFSLIDDMSTGRTRETLKGGWGE